MSLIKRLNLVILLFITLSFYQNCGQSGALKEGDLSQNSVAASSNSSSETNSANSNSSGQPTSTQWVMSQIPPDANSNTIPQLENINTPAEPTNISIPHQERSPANTSSETSSSNGSGSANAGSTSTENTTSNTSSGSETHNGGSEETHVAIEPSTRPSEELPGEEEVDVDDDGNVVGKNIGCKKISALMKLHLKFHKLGHHHIKNLVEISDQNDFLLKDKSGFFDLKNIGFLKIINIKTGYLFGEAKKVELAQNIRGISVIQSQSVAKVNSYKGVMCLSSNEVESIDGFRGILEVDGHVKSVKNFRGILKVNGSLSQLYNFKGLAIVNGQIVKSNLSGHPKHESEKSPQIHQPNEESKKEDHK